MEFDIDRVIQAIRNEVSDFKLPLVDHLASTGYDPFRILVCAALSSRTKDSVTSEACKRLWSLGKTPKEIINVPASEIEKAIYPVGFYRVKARSLITMCQQLVNGFDSRVPDTLEELVKLKGVGRKTASLVLTRGFQKQAICVDTHVHRFFNRIGYVKTIKPVETENALMSKLPEKYWIEINGLIVAFGQNICTPASPFCSRCPISGTCPRTDVKKSR